jgi:hypothetical protein
MASSAPVKGDPEFNTWKIGYDQGMRDGEVAMRGKIIDFVTNRYIDTDKGPERGSPEAEAHLDLLRGIGKELNFEVPSK